MISNDPAEPLPQASPLPGAGNPGSTPPDPRRPIEVVPQGNGTVNDPSATDTKPPGVEDFELLF